MKTALIISFLLALASPQVLADEQACADRKFDVQKIAGGKTIGYDKDTLHKIVNRSVGELGEERASDVNVLIEEAYAYKGDIEDWMKAKTDEACNSI